MLLGGEHIAQTSGAGGRVLWLALGASFSFLTQAAEMFAETRTRAHELFCLRLADVAFSEQNASWNGGNDLWRTALKFGF